MAYDGSGGFSVNDGTYTGPGVNAARKAASLKVTAASLDAMVDGIATGLSNCLCKDGQQTATADQPMGGFKHTNVDDAAARNQYAAAGQVQDGSFTWCGTAGGTANALTLTPSPAITAVAAGQRFVGIAASANSGPATVAVSGLGLENIKKSDSTGAAAHLAANDIRAGQLIDLVYDGTQYILVNAGSFAVLRTPAVTSDSSLTLTATGANNIQLTANSNTCYWDTSGIFRPSADTTLALGAAGYRWGNVHAVTVNATTFNLATKATCVITNYSELLSLDCNAAFNSTQFGYALRNLATLWKKFEAAGLGVTA